MNRHNTPRIAFIGFGEAGQAIAAGLRAGGIEQIAAWDILFPGMQGARLKAAADGEPSPAPSPRDSAVQTPGAPLLRV